MKPYYLYKITNKVNNKLYIGITSDVKRRKSKHFSKSKQTNQTVIRTAMDKHGRENFEFEIICVGEKDYILDLEVRAINLYKTRTRNLGYNIKPGGESGCGYTIASSKRDTPVFVSGWWFPVRRVAIRALNITTHIYKNRQREGTLGDIVRGRKDIVYDRTEAVNPVYVSGFWFTNRSLAALNLGIPYATVNNRVQKGYVEAKRSYREQSSEQNHMFGIDPKDHPSSISVIINDIKFDSIKQATEATGYSKYIINSRIKENHPDFQYA
jgi:group I intron endonuclease